VKRSRLKRTAELRPDPEKVREFLQRGGGSLKRTSGLKARPRRRPQEGPLTPSEWRLAAFTAAHGRCIVTGARARSVEDRNFHVHHPLDAAELRARKLYAYVWDPRNALWVARDAHMAHEHTGGEARIPREVLPASVWAFCFELDRLAGTQWATERVRRDHPATGSSGRSSRGGSSGEG
jgi:hypothetical protein